MENANRAIRTARLFEFYVRYLWPSHRLFAKNRIHRRCSNCAASEKMIPLDPRGLCQACVNYKNPVDGSSASSQEEMSQLNELLKSSTGKGRGSYDALVLFSGGKDSTYMIKRIQSEHPDLRLLAFSIDNGFMSPVAHSNINLLIEKLGIDHIFFRPRKSFYVQLFRYALTHLNEDGGYGTLDFSDGEAMLDAARNFAAEKSIPLILCGYSRYQVQNGLKLHEFESPRSTELSDRSETAGMRIQDIFPGEEIPLWWKASRWPEDQIARLIFPLYVWNLQEEEIKFQVKSWGLLPSADQSPIVTNHRLVALIGVVDVHQFGYSSFEKEFCRMIREGKSDKRYWQPIFEFLEYTSRTGLFVQPIVEQSLAELGLRMEDVGIQFKKTAN